MAITLKLEPELAAKVQTMADAEGMPIERFLEQLIEQWYYADLAAREIHPDAAVASGPD